MDAVGIGSPGSATPKFEGLPVEIRYAPIHCLDTGAMVALDSQICGEPGTSLTDPRSLRAAARAMGQESVLDRLKLSMVQNAPPSPSVLVSVDLDTAVGVDSACVPFGWRVIVIVTQESLVSHPAQALSRIAAARAAGMSVAVDEIGTHPKALALLSLAEPDIVITSPELISRPADHSIARVAHAVAAYSERSGAIVIADGVENDRHRHRARGVGARLAMGGLYPSAPTVGGFGDPVTADLSETPRLPPPYLSLLHTPFSIASPGRRRTRSLKRLLVSMSRSLEMQAVNAGPDTVVLGTFQRAEHFTTRSQARWAQLAEQVAFSGVYGVGVLPFRDSNVHHAPLDPDDPLVGEWNVVVLGSHFCGALSAKDLRRGNIDRDREFEYVVSYDRRTVTRCAHSILARFTHD